MNKFLNKLIATCFLFLFAGMIHLSANDANSAVYQGITVTGTVTENGTPMPGVNVVVKGTTFGQVTNANGQYTIAVPNSNAVLVFSFVGYTTQEFTVGNQTTINVSLAEDAALIEEVVVVGYGTMRRSDLTGSVSSVSAELLTAFPSQSVTQALQGRAPGLQVITNNAEPGGSFRIRVRGGSSLNSSNDPLYVVDGFPGGMMPRSEDIESVEILKDASATAIYGSRASNGVVLITTKQGKVGRAKVEWTSSYSTDNVAKKIEVMNAQEFAEFINDIQARNGQLPTFQNPKSLETTDWFDLVTRTGYVQNHQLAVSGGSDKVKYYNSFNYFDQNGIIINSGYKRYSATSRLNYNVGERITVGTNLFFERGMTKTARTQESSGGGTETGVISGSLIFEPTTPIYGSDGSYSLAQFGDVKDNPYAMAKEYIGDGTNDRFQGQVRAEIKIIEGLTFTTTFGATISNNRSSNYWPVTLRKGKGANGEAYISAYKRIQTSNENYFSYNKSFGKHRINAMAGYSHDVYRNENWAMTNQNFPRDQYLWWNMSAGASRLSNSSGLNEWQNASFYGRLMYNFDNRYLFTGTVRYDGSSRMGADSKWGTFPSAALAWNVKNEQFMQSIDMLSQLKLRASYGIVGNSSIGEYMSWGNMATTTATVNETQVPGMRPDVDRVENRKLSWESTSQTNFGVDIGFFKSRLNISADYFIKETTDLLYRMTLVGFSGYNRTWMNYGTLGYKGFELAINSVNFQTGDFYWRTDFQLSSYKNEVIFIPGNEVLDSQWPGHIIGAANTGVLRKGAHTGAFYGYRYHGVDRETGAPLYLRKDENGNWMDTPVPFSQTSASRDRDIIGNPHPKFEYGLNNSFHYKNFDLDIFFQGVYGNDMYNFTRAELEWGNGKVNQMKTMVNRWTETNKDSNIPVANSGYGMNSSTRWIEKGTYLRLRNVSLGYNIQIQTLQNLGVEKFRVFVSGQNLFIITDYSGFDPDISYRSSNTIMGYDYGSYPSTRSFTFGLNVIF